MSNVFSRVRNIVASLPAEDRPEFKSVDASSVRYDDGTWLEPVTLRNALVRVNV